MRSVTSLSTIRLLAFCLAALGVLAKPMLVFAADAHTARHVLLTGQDGHSKHDSPTKVIDADDAADPWHVLMHVGDCCGHSVALDLKLSVFGQVPVRQTLASIGWCRFSPGAHPVPHRPPILA